MYKFDYKKNLGQNFLQDKNIIDKIVNAPDYGDNNLVIEIGPGAGALTKELLKKVDRAILYEVDTRLEKILNKELSTFVNYELIFDDFLNRDVKKDISKTANIPLNSAETEYFADVTPNISTTVDGIPTTKYERVFGR